MIPQELHDIRVFDGCPRDARADLATKVSALVGPAFEPGASLVGARGLVSVVHRATKLVFVAVPGGTFEMGLTEADLEAVSEHVDFTSEVRAATDALRRRASPVRTVRVEPFLCSVELLGPDALKTLSGGRLDNPAFEPYELPEKVKPFLDQLPDGLRLTSEAELEFVAREGGSMAIVNDGGRVLAESGEWPNENGFGIRELSAGEVAADAWHEQYRGAPATAVAWEPERGPGVRRGGLALGIDEVGEELLFALAAWRISAAESEEPMQLRLARSL